MLDLSKLKWLDLSFNALTYIDGQEFARLPSLSILNLHSNCLAGLRQVLSLKPISSLRQLTLFDNPMQAEPQYRLRVVAILPQLKQFDYQVCTTVEKRNAERFAGQTMAQPASGDSTQKALAPHPPGKKVSDKATPFGYSVTSNMTLV